MKGLLYKEAVALWRNKLYLLMLLVFAAIPAISLMGYSVAFSAVLPMMLIQIDEQAKWGRLSVMLPYSDLQLVLPKYLYTWALLLLTSATTVISRVIQGVDAGEALFQAALYLAVGILLCAVTAPLFFRFGTQRARAVMMVAIGIFVVTAVALTGILSERNIDISGMLRLPGVLLPLSFAASALSVYISRRCYRKGLRV